MNDETQELRLKPVFIGRLLMLAQVPIQLFLAVWTSGFFIDTNQAR